jgi:hypothetical protein
MTDIATATTDKPAPSPRKRPPLLIAVLFVLIGGAGFGGLPMLAIHGLAPQATLVGWAIGATLVAWCLYRR